MRRFQKDHKDIDPREVRSLVPPKAGLPPAEPGNIEALD